MEAVFSFGPLSWPITRHGKVDGPAESMRRVSVPKTNGTDIETALFLKPEFAGVSAVLQAHTRDLYDKALDLSIIHNPLAKNRLPTGLLGGTKEFVASERDDGYLVSDILATRRN